MNTIHINIDDKRATLEGAPSIVCGNSDYQIQFTFDAEWAEHNAKTARYVYVQKGQIRYTDVEFSGNLAPVPILSNTKEVQVGVFAGDGLTSTAAKIPCELSARCTVEE